MYRIRRSDTAPRMEMTPMIDVIFLLLTFFIYSMVMMIRAQVLPVQLTVLASGAQGSGGQFQAITIDREGKLFFNREAVSAEQLEERLRRFAADPGRGTLFLAMEARGDSDRGPLFIRLIEQVRSAGITDFAIVGQPEAGSQSGEPGPLE